MAKVEVVEIKAITLTLDMEEAKKLRSILANSSGLYFLFCQLNDVLL